MFVYLDDILIFSPDVDTQVSHVGQVLKPLVNHHLLVKAEKGVSQTFLCYVTSESKVQMDPAKVKAVLD